MIDLITISPAHKIKQAGAYRMEMNHYHSQCCIGPSVSSSGLRTIELQSPHEFWSFSDLNPDRFWKEGEADALRFGRAAHALLLGDEDFDAGFALRPEAFTSYNTKAAREWRDETIKGGRSPITPTELEHIVAMSKALAAAGVRDTMMDGTPEASLIWQDKTGVWLKSRMDMLPNSGDMADLKTTADASKRACERAITNHGYHMQVALGVMGMEQVLGRRPPEGGCFLIFVKKAPPYTVNIVPISEDAIYWGKAQIRRAINTFADCLESGQWPNDNPGFAEYELPKWLADSLSNQQIDGRLPNEEGEKIDG